MILGEAKRKSPKVVMHQIDGFLEDSDLLYTFHLAIDFALVRNVGFIQALMPVSDLWSPLLGTAHCPLSYSIRNQSIFNLFV